MEKITFQPLIKHLQENTSIYNQLYIDFELKYGHIGKQLLHKWMVNVVQPVIVSIADQHLGRIPAVFKAFYTTILRLLGNGKAIRFEHDYESAWLLCRKVPNLTAATPDQVIQCINQALDGMQRYQPASSGKWITFMDKSIEVCTSLEDLRTCGRLNAWFCGLAQLRVKCSETFELLPDVLKQRLQEISPAGHSIPFLLKNIRPVSEQAIFVGAAGGFYGFGGSFKSPPLLVQSGDTVFATDRKNSYALFADHFGSVLLPHVSDNLLKREATNSNNMKAFRNTYGKNLAAFDDISSYVLKDATLYVTRQSSHFIYLYAC